MEDYNYYEAVKEDIRNALEETEERDYDRLYEQLWIDDSVTGNGSGSYYCNSWKAEEAICHNLDLLGEALEMFCCGPGYLMENGAEAADVTIRCYVLSECLSEVLEELEEEEEAQG